MPESVSGAGNALKREIDAEMVLTAKEVDEVFFYEPCRVIFQHRKGPRPLKRKRPAERNAVCN